VIDFVASHIIANHLSLSYGSITQSYSLRRLKEFIELSD